MEKIWGRGDVAAPPPKGEEAGDGRKKEAGDGRKKDVPVPDWLYVEREILRIEMDARDRKGGASAEAEMTGGGWGSARRTGAAANTLFIEFNLYLY